MIFIFFYLTLSGIPNLYGKHWICFLSLHSKLPHLYWFKAIIPCILSRRYSAEADQKSEAGLAGSSAWRLKLKSEASWDEFSPRAQSSLAQVHSGCWQSSVPEIVARRPLFPWWLSVRHYSSLLEAAHSSFPCGPTGSHRMDISFLLDELECMHFLFCDHLEKTLCF